MERLEFIIEAKDKFSKEMSGLLGHMSSLPNVAMMAAGAIASVGAGLFALSKSSAEAYQEVGNMATQLGISTEALSKFRWAANMSDVENAQLEMGLKKLSVAIGNASTGNVQAMQTFQNLGISVKNADGSIKSVDQVLPEVAAGLGNMDSSAQKAAVAADLFGARNLAMLQMVGQGKEKLAELTDEAERFGKVVPQKTVDAAEQFDDGFKRMSGAVGGLKNKFAAEFFPSFAGGMNTFANLIADNRDTIIKWGGVAAEVIGAAGKVVIYFGAVVADAFRAVHAVWEGTKTALATLGQIFFETFAKIASKVADFEEALNFRGIFDEDIAAARSFAATWGNIGGSLGSVAEDAAGEVNAYWEGGMAKSQKAALIFFDTMKIGMENAKSSSKKGAGGVTLYDPKAAEEAKKAYDAAYKDLLAQHDQYCLTDAEQLDAWYAKEREIFKGHKDALLILEQTYQAKKNELPTVTDDYPLIDPSYMDQALSDLDTLGFAWSGYEASRKAATQDAVNNIIAMTGDLAAAQAYQAEEDKRLALEKNDFILEHSTVLQETMTAAWQNFALESGTFMGDVANASVGMFDSFAAGVGSAVAQTVVYGESMSKAFGNLMRGIAAQVISTLIQIGVTRMAQWALARSLGISEASARMGTLSAETYAGAFASTVVIPIIGPALAPIVAAAAQATMLAGSAAAGASGAGMGGGIAGAFHGGATEVPAEASYLLQRGERVLSPRQNEDLTQFIEGGGGGGSPIYAEAINFNFHVTDLDALRRMDRRDWQDLAEESIVPALTELKRRGVYVK